MCKINAKEIREAIKAKGTSMRKLSMELGKGENYVNNCLQKGEMEQETAQRMYILLDMNHDVVEVVKERSTTNYADGRNHFVDVARNSYKGKKKLSPEEVDEFIAKHRKESEEEIAETVEFITTNAIQAVGNKKYIFANPTHVYVPTEIQRELDMLRAMSISDGFSEKLYDPIKVTVIDGKLYVVDGDHRLVALILKNRKLIQMELLDVDLDEAARIFANQAFARKNPTASDMYRSEIRQKNKDMLALKEVFQINGNIQISVEKEKLENSSGTITPNGTFIRMAVRQRETTEKVIDLIKGLGWNATKHNAFKVCIFNAIFDLISNYGEDVVFKNLKEKANGAEFFEGYLTENSKQASIYDKLVEHAFTA